MSYVKYSPCPKCVALGRDSRGDNLVTWPDGGSHCFSCGYHIRPKSYRPSNEPINVPKALLPADFTREVPAYAFKWLFQYQLPYSYWKESIGFSPKDSRLVFLVGSPTQFSMGRYVPEPGQSHDPTRRKWYVWGDCHKHAEVYGKGSKVVLVEDLISAAKIAESGAGVEAIPLFGTRIHNPVLYYLMQEQKPVVLWLDKDQQQRVYKEAARLQGIVGQPVQVVVSDKDPKALTFKEIKEAISENC